MMRNRQCLLALSLVLLAGCEAQSEIQSRYISQQSDCRDTAEDRMDDAPNANKLNDSQRNAQLVDFFSTCMIKSGWHVARPVKNPAVPTPPGTAKNPKEAALPAQPLPGQPSDVVTAGARSGTPQASSPPNEPVKTQPTLLQPSPSTPALSNPAAPVGGNPAPSTYQPVGRRF